MTPAARNNPFAVQRREALPLLFSDAEWATFWRRFEALGGRGAIVGPHGSGKTTFVRSLIPRLEERGFEVRHHHLRTDARCVPRQMVEGVDASTALILDSAEQLGPLAWRRFLRRSRPAGAVLITVHSPARLPTVLERAPSVDRLAAIVRMLTGDDFSRYEPLLDAAYAVGDGNLRDALDRLYDDACTGAAAPVAVVESDPDSTGG